MAVKAKMLREPLLHPRGLMGAVVIQNQMDIQMFGGAAIQAAQEAQEFVLAMPGNTFPQSPSHPAIRY